MKLTKLYDKYHQKSKTFLFPLTTLQKNANIQPVNTYLTWDDNYTIDKHRLMALYEENNSPGFNIYLNNVLKVNPFYEDVHKTVNNDTVIVFDLSRYKNMWGKFCTGWYSGFDDSVKKSILKYYSKSTQEYELVNSFLYPDRYWEEYSYLLDVPYKDLRLVNELCNVPNMEKENLTLVKMLEINQTISNFEQ